MPPPAPLGVPPLICKNSRKRPQPAPLGSQRLVIKARTALAYPQKKADIPLSESRSRTQIRSAKGAEGGIPPFGRSLANPLGDSKSAPARRMQGVFSDGPESTEHRCTSGRGVRTDPPPCPSLEASKLGPAGRSRNAPQRPLWESQRLVIKARTALVYPQKKSRHSPSESRSRTQIRVGNRVAEVYPLRTIPGQPRSGTRIRPEQGGLRGHPPPAPEDGAPLHQGGRWVRPTRPLAGVPKVGQFQSGSRSRIVGS
jgi:hypothetical protein